MAKQVIILDRVPTQDGTLAFNVAFWLAVPAARQSWYANPDIISAYKDATPAEKTALTTGAVLELVLLQGFDNAKTITQIRTDLQNAFNQLQADFTATNRWARYGTSWDGAGWTPGGN